MDFRYPSAYKVQGIVHDPEQPDVMLAERPDLSMRAFLTGDVDSHCYLLDRERALAVMMLSGELNDENFDEVLTAVCTAIDPPASSMHASYRENFLRER